MTEKPDSKQLLLRLVEKTIKEIYRLNLSILENATELIITTRTIFTMNNVLTLKGALPLRFEGRDFSDVLRHLYFVNYYNQLADCDIYHVG